MQEILFITHEEIVKTTIIGGNVDIDKFNMCILNTQLRVIEPLLGSELYNKIKTDLPSGLSGLYLELFEDYVQPITKYDSCSDYISISPYTLSNNGLFKMSPENTQIVSQKEVESLSSRYSSISETFVSRFKKWIDLNGKNIPEYKKFQDGVNAIDINTNNGWYFG